MYLELLIIWIFLSIAGISIMCYEIITNKKLSFKSLADSIF